MKTSIASKAGVVLLAVILGEHARLETDVVEDSGFYGIIPTCGKPRTPRVGPFEPG